MSNRIFDYDKAAADAGISQTVLDDFVQEARREFPWDDMLMELHVIRAINAYVSQPRADRVATN